MKNTEYKGPPVKKNNLQFEDVFRSKNNLIRENHNFGLPADIANELKILKSINQTLETNSDIVSLIPGFFEAREAFRGFLFKISEKYAGLKETLIKSYQKIADALRNYGVMTENAEIISLSNQKESFLRNCGDQEIVRRANLILENARLYLTTLNYFGISHENIENLRISVSKFSYASGLWTENAFERPLWKDELDRDFDEAYSFIHNTLDGYLESIKEKFPKFYTEYVSAKTSMNLSEH